MDKQAIQQVEYSFRLISNRHQAFVDNFYAQFIEQHPELAHFFSGVDMAGQRRKLLLAMVTIVDNLHSPEELRRSLHELGGKHARMNIQPYHYDLFRDVLINTLKRTLGKQWSDEMEQAWYTALNQVTDIMLNR